MIFLKKPCLRLSVKWEGWVTQYSRYGNTYTQGYVHNIPSNIMMVLFNGV